MKEQDVETVSSDYTEATTTHAGIDHRTPNPKLSLHLLLTTKKLSWPPLLPPLYYPPSCSP